MRGHLDKTVVVLRLTDSATVDIEEYDTVIASLNVQIQPLEASFSEDLAGSYGKNFLMFVDDDTAILQEDIIRDGNDEYTVVGVERFDFLNDQHLEVEIRSIKHTS
jgi:hypothetical protein